MIVVMLMIYLEDRMTFEPNFENKMDPLRLGKRRKVGRLGEM